MDPSDIIDLSIPAKADYIGVVRLTISGIASRMGFSYDDIEDIKVAVSEAITNAVQHAYHQEEKGKVMIRVQSFTDRMDIFVSDSGQSFDIDEVAQNPKGIDKTASFEELTEGGLGLFLIETLMDRVDISGDTGVIVHMSKFIDKGGVDRYAGKISSRD
jgi:serine/threonine-protein kinase RsbW